MRQRSMITQQKVNSSKVELSKRFRRKMTNAEALLWERIRKSQLGGIHFRRQQILFGFIADFYCHSKRLVIEVDGDIHKTQIEKDRAREAVFTQNGLSVIRFTNEQVENNIEEVLTGILGVVRGIES